MYYFNLNICELAALAKKNRARCQHLRVNPIVDMCRHPRHVSQICRVLADMPRLRDLTGEKSLVCVQI